MVRLCIRTPGWLLLKSDSNIKCQKNIQFQTHRLPALSPPSLIPLTNYALFSSLCCSGVRTKCAAHIALILADVSLPERFFFFFFVWKPARHFFQTDPVSAYSEGKGLLFFFQRCYGKFNLFALIHLHPRRSTRKPHSRGQFLASRRFCPVSYSPVRDYRLNIIFMS